MKTANLGLAVRSVGWAVLLPGVVAGYVPWRLFGVRNVRLDVLDPLDVAGGVLVAGGLAILATTIWEFAHQGRGTLAPVDPPRTLVVHGLYRYVRNPMYLGVSLILLGEAVLARSSGLALYWAAWFGAVNAFVIGYEEPTLRSRFGSAYDDYRARVGRWTPRATRKANAELTINVERGTRK